jgi:hypothetical protein
MISSFVNLVNCISPSDPAWNQFVRFTPRLKGTCENAGITSTKRKGTNTNILFLKILVIYKSFDKTYLSKKVNTFIFLVRITPDAFPKLKNNTNTGVNGSKALYEEILRHVVIK